MKIRIPIVNVPLRFVLRPAITLFVVVAIGISVWLFSRLGLVRADPVAQWAQPEESEGLRLEQERREQRQREYIREHSDPSGNVRPEAYVKGIEHVRGMKIAPYIGAKPLGEATPTPAN
jgi:hypothetical protein